MSRAVSNHVIMELVCLKFVINENKLLKFNEILWVKQIENKILNHTGNFALLNIQNPTLVDTLMFTGNRLLSRIIMKVVIMTTNKLYHLSLP